MYSFIGGTENTSSAHHVLLFYPSADKNVHNYVRILKSIYWRTDILALFVFIANLAKIKKPPNISVVL